MAFTETFQSIHTIHDRTLDIQVEISTASTVNEIAEATNRAQTLAFQARSVPLSEGSKYERLAVFEARKVLIAECDDMERRALAKWDDILRKLYPEDTTSIS